jgi:hypothetical protein
VVTNQRLTVVFGLLLLLAAFGEGTGLARRLRFRGWVAWAAGAASGFLGGLVGNQGGIRSAALIGFSLPKESFVATATAIALFVDGARLPIYLAKQHDQMFVLWPSIMLATLGVLTGTLLGGHVLKRIPEIWFRRVLAGVLAVLGATMLTRVL